MVLDRPGWASTSFVAWPSSRVEAWNWTTAPVRGRSFLSGLEGEPELVLVDLYRQAAIRVKLGLELSLVFTAVELDLDLV